MLNAKTPTCRVPSAFADATDRQAFTIFAFGCAFRVKRSAFCVKRSAFAFCVLR